MNNAVALVCHAPSSADRKIEKGPQKEQNEKKNASENKQWRWATDADEKQMTNAEHRPSIREREHFVSFVRYFFALNLLASICIYFMSNINIAWTVLFTPPPMIQEKPFCFSLFHSFLHFRVSRELGGGKLARNVAAYFRGMHRRIDIAAQFVCSEFSDELVNINMSVWWRQKKNNLIMWAIMCTRFLRKRTLLMYNK